jgi:hypothetical protein
VSRPSWWTPADQAELDAIVRALVRDYYESHRPRCPVCRAGYPPCPQLREAVELVVEWTQARDVLFAGAMVA